MSYWEGKSVMVTGGSGFLGSHLTSDLLSLNADVTVVDTEAFPPYPEPDGDFHFENVDVTDFEAVKDVVSERSVDLIYHLAAESLVGVCHDEPLTAFKTNVEGTWNVLETVRQVEHVSDGVVVASSDKAYGPIETLPYSEEVSLQPNGPYSTSKMAADRIAHAYYATYDVPVTITRCANLYGPGDRHFSHAVPSIIKGYLVDGAPEIRSDGTPTRDYLYIDDAVNGYRKLGRHTTSFGGEAFNFGTNTETSIRELATMIGDLLGETSDPVIRDSAEGYIDRQRVDASKASDVLDWRADVSIEEGLERTIPWYEKKLA